MENPKNHIGIGKVVFHHQILLNDKHQNTKNGELKYSNEIIIHATFATKMVVN